MNSKELFMLIDRIDERYIDEAWGSSDDNDFYRDIDIDYDSDRRRGVSLVLEHRPFRAFAPLVVTAACMLLFVAGGFTALNIFRGELLIPGSRVENPASYIESSSSEDSSASQDEISDIEKYYYDFKLSIEPGKEANTGGMEKLNNLGYAEIIVEDTNATAEHPIIARILKSPPKGGLEPISEGISIFGQGTYEIPYTTPRGAGSYSYLYLEYPDWYYDENGMPIQGHIIGTCSP